MSDLNCDLGLISGQHHNFDARRSALLCYQSGLFPRLVCEAHEADQSEVMHREPAVRTSLCILLPLLPLVSHTEPVCRLRELSRVQLNSCKSKRALPLLPEFLLGRLYVLPGSLVEGGIIELTT